MATVSPGQKLRPLYSSFGQLVKLTMILGKGLLLLHGNFAVLITCSHKKTSLGLRKTQSWMLSSGPHSSGWTVTLRLAKQREYSCSLFPPWSWFLTPFWLKTLFNILVKIQTCSEDGRNCHTPAEAVNLYCCYCIMACMCCTLFKAVGLEEGKDKEVLVQSSWKSSSPMNLQMKSQAEVCPSLQVVNQATYHSVCKCMFTDILHLPRLSVFTCVIHWLREAQICLVMQWKLLCECLTATCTALKWSDQEKPVAGNEASTVVGQASGLLIESWYGPLSIWGLQNTKLIHLLKHLLCCLYSGTLLIH